MAHLTKSTIITEFSDGTSKIQEQEYDEAGKVVKQSVGTPDAGCFNPMCAYRAEIELVGEERFNEILREGTAPDGIRMTFETAETTQDEPQEPILNPTNEAGYQATVAPDSFPVPGTSDEKRDAGDRRKIERRAPKRGVNVRHDDADDRLPKRVRRAQKPK